MLDRGISNIISMCVQLYRNCPGATEKEYRDNSLFVQLSDILRNAFTGVSLLHEGLFPGWKADRQHPGYLIKIETPFILRAPFHLLPIFPSGEYLDDVWRIS